MAYPPRVRPSRDGRAIQVRFQHRGRTFSETLRWTPTETNLTKAARYAEDWHTRVRYGLDEARGPSPTFAAVAQEYLNGCGLKLSTRNAYRDSLNRYWLDDLAHRPVDGIAYRTLRAVDRRIEWPGPKTRKNAITALRRVFGYAVEEDLRPDNPAAQFRVRKIQKAGPDPYTEAERDALLAWAHEHMPPTPRLFLRIAFGTGMRTGEIIALRWEDFDGRSLAVERARVRREIAPTKTDDARAVLVTSDLRAELREYPDRFAGGWILRTYTGRPYLSAHKLLKWYRRALTALEIRERTGPYPWRHTYASVGVSRGARPAWLAQQLGHSLETFYRVYATWIRADDDAGELAKLESWRGSGDSAPGAARGPGKA